MARTLRRGCRLHCRESWCDYLAFQLSAITITLKLVNMAFENIVQIRVGLIMGYPTSRACEAKQLSWTLAVQCGGQR